MNDEITGDLYSSCPKCGAMNTKFIGTTAGDPKYECGECGNHFFPHMQFMMPQGSGLKEYLEGGVAFEGWLRSQKETTCPKCGHKFTV